jgi:hypothetical protein
MYNKRKCSSKRCGERRRSAGNSQKSRGFYDVRPFFFLIFISLLLIPIASASNFGSVSKYDVTHIGPNQTAQFSLLFWTEDESRTIALKAAAPENWQIEMPDRINIGSGSGNEMVYTSAYTHAQSVILKARPDKYVQGSYHIIVSAATISGNGGLTFSQERIFNLTVIVDGKKIDIVVPEQPPEDYKFPLAIALILFISFLIYRYS